MWEGLQGVELTWGAGFLQTRTAFAVPAGVVPVAVDALVIALGAGVVLFVVDYVLGVYGRGFCWFCLFFLLGWWLRWFLYFHLWKHVFGEVLPDSFHIGFVCDILKVSVFFLYSLYGLFTDICV